MILRIDIISRAYCRIVTKRSGGDAIVDGEGGKHAAQRPDGLERSLRRRTDQLEPRACNDRSANRRLGMQRGVQSDQSAQRMAELNHRQSRLLRGKIDHRDHVALQIGHAGDAALALFFDIAAVSAVILGINRHSVRIHKVRKFLIAVAVLP